MRDLLSIFLIASFMLISVFANFGNSHAMPVDEETTSVHSTIEKAVEQFTNIDVEKIDAGFSEDAKDEECPCKKDSSATKFVCGVTLALANNADVEHPPVLQKSAFIIVDAKIHNTFVDSLKRPPRTTL